MMFRAHPIFGVGLGAFQTVYPIYGRSDGSVLIEFAHNDYLQILSDAGLVGGVLAIWFLVVTARNVARAAKNTDPLLRSLGIGSGAGILALLVHSLFDFNLQIPSNALVFLLLSAIVARSGVTVTLGDAARKLCPRVEEPATAAG
jgi:O-antigen ligase